MDNNLDNTQRLLEKIKPEVIKKAQLALATDKRNATGKLRESFNIVIKLIPRGIIFAFEYAAHGMYVLKSKRTYKARFPSQAAIEAISKWILDKGISYKSRVKGGQPDQIKVLKSMAIAIWLKQRQNGRIWAPLGSGRDGTNFIKPFNDLVDTTTRASNFKKDLRKSLALDGKQSLIRNMKAYSTPIKIKM